MKLGEFVKAKRNAVKLTQPELAEKAGVGLRFVRELEQGKESVRLDKVNQVLKLFGSQVGPVALTSNERPQ
jgi:y4mF family transcriptional regulator